ncbi:Gfo/Idh/MocA family protein [Actomonas aquatica]|uniref:Gfo/Idh/MocA family oxidoreductase n=1 Tax=Actomonas aquatica TaxID=2866162 RepID=A0ABZ1C6T5_9BACT|nr:Gfo/Idh/MocA family oxidoreductase [Opitutus sp. WL0086]WRQ87080.1 Gfo/Idh/MocA family oxidoreductase [Opitutus sp. WL0086]
MSSSDGMTYAPKGKPSPVVQPGEFTFATVHLDHGHIYGQTNGLIEAGAELKWVYDPDPAKVEAYCKQYPQARVARSLDEVLEDESVQLVSAAAIPNLRGDLGCQVMRAGKDYFTDKTPFTAFDQFERAKQVVAETGRKYAVYFSERLHVESAMYATDLIKDGAIGRVIQVLGLGPHRLNAPSRPDWFFKKEQYGGILCDIGSHQFEQFLTFSGATDATVSHAAIANYNHPDHPELDDFGEANLVGNNGATNYVRVDWFTPDGLRTWGDGRMIILGTDGYIELRKYVDVGREPHVADQVFLVDQKGEHHFDVTGKIGYRFFGELILDCLHRTEKAMTQDHIFTAARLCLEAQAQAKVITS